eukprot:CAMPEP_0172793572 /NCGR_PEP_ID=MMETSP1074-20121228/209542_1 /TAXON_ID=2916 /ORGANISM="Ceratium fusus, Strain PA161109" /LENGTH=143 /DNA_ID=CAMNT_0013630645 /DNA_START=396 /DNA_END=824 /DNA_ORIENTATION=-
MTEDRGEHGREAEVAALWETASDVPKFVTLEEDIASDVPGDTVRASARVVVALRGLSGVERLFVRPSGAESYLAASSLDGRSAVLAMPFSPKSLAGTNVPPVFAFSNFGFDRCLSSKTSLARDPSNEWHALATRIPEAFGSCW